MATPLIKKSHMWVLKLIRNGSLNKGGKHTEDVIPPQRRKDGHRQATRPSFLLLLPDGSGSVSCFRKSVTQWAQVRPESGAESTAVAGVVSGVESWSNCSFLEEEWSGGAAWGFLCRGSDIMRGPGSFFHFFFSLHFSQRDCFAIQTPHILMFFSPLQFIFFPSLSAISNGVHSRTIY